MCFIYPLLVSSACGQRDSLLVEGFENLSGWRTGGQKEICFDLSDRYVTEGQHSLHLHVEIDHENGGEYPMAWPSVTKEYESSIDLSKYDFLEMDIYFESQQHLDPDFAITIILMDSEGRDFYRTTFIDLRDRKWAHEKLCIRDLTAASDFTKLHFFLSESLYDHGDIVDFYIDGLRAIKATDCRPPKVSPVRHLVAMSDAAFLWTEGPARKIMRTDQEDLPERAYPVIEMSAARNETEAVQLVLRPTVEGGLGQVALEAGELAGARGVRIGSENIFWSPVHYVPAKEGPPEGLPDGLPGPKPFIADQQWHYPIWLEVYVPPGTPSGDYFAPVTVYTGSGNYFAELRLHVWDFDIPVKQSLRTSTCVYGPYGWREDIKKWYGNMDYGTYLKEWLPSMFRMLAKYRISPSNLYHLPFYYDEGNREVILGDTAEFEQFFQYYMDMGHHSNVMPVPYFFDRDSFLGARKGSKEYLSCIMKAYSVAADYLDRKGWLKGSYAQCADEVIVNKHIYGEDFDLLNHVLDAIKAAHPEIRIFSTEVPSPILTDMDTWCINISCFDTDVLEEQHALGKEVWWYNGYTDPRPGMHISAHGVAHRALSWITYKYGIDGYLIWTVNRWTNNPWEEPNRNERAVAGDHYLLYPNPDSTVSPSIRICMMRDGLEDYEYHRLLERLAERLRASGKIGLAAQCEETIRKADSFILAYDNCMHIKPEFIYNSRRMLAEQIEKAQKHCVLKMNEQRGR